MLISDISVKRPVFATVISLLLIAFGLVAFDRLPLREYPDIDPPVVTVDVNYPGAPANIVETRIIERVEERIAGIEGINFIESESEDGEGEITLEFNVGRDIDAAANDVRDKVSGVRDNLPDDAETPEVQKVDSGDDVIVWFNLVSPEMTVPELTDYADRYLVDRFSVLDGVARVRIGGDQSYALRIWLDRKALAANALTVSDVEQALRDENIELPAGSIQSDERIFKARVERTFKKPSDFNNLVLSRGDDGHLVKLGDVARVEKGVVEDRTFFRGNGVPQVGIGIIKQSNANSLAVARAAKERMEIVNRDLPEHIELSQSYDATVFVENAISEVYETLLIALGCVVVVMYLFLGSPRTTIIPAITVPVSVIATSIILYGLGFSVNLLTLLAVVLAIGLVVDDAIVMLENIYRRMDEEGETPLVAAYRGARQVGFAIVATTLVLISVFVPITFLQGDIGRLFTEFAMTMAAAVIFSSLVALTLTPVLASKILKRNTNGKTRVVQGIDWFLRKLRRGYMWLLRRALRRPVIVIILFFGIFGGAAWLYTNTPSEYAPREDRGAFFLIVDGPEGASYDYIAEYMNEIERRLMSYVDNGEMSRLLVRAPRSFGNIENFNSGLVIAVLEPWAQRRDATTIMNEIRGKLSDLPGVRAFPVMRQAFGGGTEKPVQFVIGGGTYDELAKWRDTLIEKAQESDLGVTGLDSNYKQTRPQIDINVDYLRAADLGVSVRDIGRTLEVMMGGRQITTYLEDGEEYDVIVEGERSNQKSFTDMRNVYARSQVTNELIPMSNLVEIEEYAAAPTLPRFNRVRAITIEANLEDGTTLGEALDGLRELTREHLPEEVIIDYRGQSRDFIYSSGSVMFVFLLGIAVVFLVLAAQFESFIHPFVIMLTVPLALAGGLLGLYLTGATLNIYSQIGLIMLVGLAAKNGILIVEFANQRRDEGLRFSRALLEAARVRMRPIVMTGLTTAAGAIPLVLASGAGSETRIVIGIVIMAGVLAATLFTLFIVPVAYSLLARRTGSPGETARRLDREASPSLSGTASRKKA